MARCPAHSFVYNGTLCACEPGRYLSNGSCAAFEAEEWATSSGVSSAPTFLMTVLPLENIWWLTQSQAMLLEAMLVTLLAWLLLCLSLRFTRLDSGRSIVWLPWPIQSFSRRPVPDLSSHWHFLLRAVTIDDDPSPVIRSVPIG